MRVPPEDDAPLAGKCIALPESRELDVLAGLFERRGATTYLCPLVNIVDSPETDVVTAWLKQFIDAPPNFFIILTGEGVNRLLGFAERGGIGRDDFIKALETTTIVARGPKPARALRKLGRSVDHAPDIATTVGIIELLKSIDLEGKRVSVQLYGDDSNAPLMEYLASRDAIVDIVAPYRYVAESTEEKIGELIDKLGDNEIDVIVFTSKSQVDRLFAVAGKLSLENGLRNGLEKTCVASIGPVVEETLKEAGCRTDISPADRYFMKPLVSEVSRKFS